MNFEKKNRSKYTVQVNENDKKRVYFVKSFAIPAALAILLAITSFVMVIIAYSKASSNQFQLIRPETVELTAEQQNQEKVFVSLEPQGQLNRLNNTIWKLIDHFGLRSTALRLPKITDKCQVYKTKFGKVLCLSNSKMNYKDAKSFCSELNMQLATTVVRSSDEKNDLISNFLLSKPNNKIWIGLDDIANEDEWLYIDGVVATHNNTDWLEGEPNNSGNREDCGHLWKDVNYTINDMTCKGRTCNALCQAKNKILI